MKSQVTVVICTFNRYDLLGKAITSIELQDFPEDRYELVIVDNSDDLAGRERFLDGLEIACNHRYFIEGRPGLSRARNVGVAARQAHETGPESFHIVGQHLGRVARRVHGDEDGHDAP